MTIVFTAPGDVAAQVYNEARREGLSHEDAFAAAWAAMQHARSNEQTTESEATEEAIASSEDG